MAATPVVSVAHESGVASWGTFAGDVPQTCRTSQPWKAARPHESPQMRLAQLPTTRQTRHTLLRHPHTRIRAAARQLDSKRIRRSTPPPPQGMGGTTGHRRNTHLRQMRTASHSRRPMGPRPHRRQTKLDRARTSQLQQERRTAQSNRKHRTLDTTLSHHSSGHSRSQQASANANTTRHRRIKRKRTNQTSTRNKNNKTHAKTGKNTINQPANTPRGVPRTARPRPPVRGLASSRIVQDLTDWPNL